MSVPKGKQTQSKFIILTKADKLLKYVIEITGNEKIFVSCYSVLTNSIISHTELIYVHCYTANKIVVNSHETYSERIAEQKMSIQECNILLALIDLAYHTFHLRGRRVSHWTNRVLEIKNLLKKWNKSDIERYRAYKK